MNIAIILARGGSKRIPGKNIKPFHGKPIIEYSINAAKESNLFHEIIVSTDSQEIADISRKAGAITPLLRPEKLADDFSTMVDVLFHDLKIIKKTYPVVKNICCIMATAPFIRVRDIVSGKKLIDSRNATSVYSITSFPFPIQRALQISCDNKLSMFWPEHELTRSNDLPEAFHDAGQFYWINIEKFLEVRKIYAEDSEPIKIPRYLVQDIDTLEDWTNAEKMYESIYKIK